MLGPFQAERDSKRSVGNILRDWMRQKGSVMIETLIPGLRLSKLFPMSKNFQTLLMGKKKISSFFLVRWAVGTLSNCAETSIKSQCLLLGLILPRL